MQKLIVGIVLSGAVLVTAIHGQSAAPKACTVQSPPAISDGDTSMRKGDYTVPESFYRSDFERNRTTDSAARLVRAELAQGKLDDALKVAQAVQQNHPQDSMAVLSLGEVRYRRGEIDQAAPLFIQAATLDPCNARAHLDISRYMEAIGLFASAERQVDVAHKLSPNDPAIGAEWDNLNPGHLTSEERIASLRKGIESGELSPAEKSRSENRMKQLDLASRGACKLTTPVESASLPLLSFDYEKHELPESGFDIDVDGSKVRLLFDTGASGITISREAADRMKLKGELKTGIGGIGDDGVTAASIFVAKQVKVGKLIFENCPVTIIEKRRDPLHYGSTNAFTTISEGLIGADFFKQFVVTVNIPERKLALSRLPSRPGSKEGPWDDQHPEDRYIAPEMKTWTSILRVGHALIVPAQLNGGPMHLMILDTGASSSIFSTTAAKEATKVGFSNVEIRGVAGKVSHVSDASRINLAFAGVQQLEDGQIALDTSKTFRGIGMEIAGLIGYPALRELVVSIDYRDNLVHVVFDPKHGIHPGLIAKSALDSQ